MEPSQGITCPLTGCPVKKLLLLSIAAFAVIFGFDWLFHGVYMMPQYEATASLWRTEAEMQEFCSYMLISQAGQALAIAMLFGFSCCKAGCAKPCLGTCLKFGFIVGLLLGISQFGCYAYMPIPLEMAVSWVMGSIVLGLLIGLVFGLLGRCCKKSCNPEERA